MKKALLLVLTCCWAGGAFSQADTLIKLQGISVQESWGDSLSSPWAGGLNLPQFSHIDLNGDTLPDLFVFDRHGNQALTFLNEGQTDYRFTEQYRDSFPELSDWAILRDYNCDGKVDIFTATPGSSTIRLYTNTSQNGGLSFALTENVLMSSSGFIFVPNTDIPAIEDVDADGDLDILSFDIGGGQVIFYENVGDCDSLALKVNTYCWGKFQEDGLTNSIILNVSCKGFTPARHSGSTLCAFDQDGDDAMELILGDLSFETVNYLHNGGTPQFAFMDAVDPNFPSYDIPIDLLLFPAAYHLDVNNDGRGDLLFAPNAPSISANYNNVLYYWNAGPDSNAQFFAQSSSFLQEDMIDVGASSNPAFFDYNGDQLEDLILGNTSYKESASLNWTALTLYENTGTQQQPEYQLVDRNYLNISSLFSPVIFAAHPSFGDLDGDGDADMILGDDDGNVHFFENSAGPGNPVNLALETPYYFGIDVGRYAAPQLIDVDRDGLLDLLIGEEAGNLNYYRNSGTATQPNFADPGDKDFGDVDVQPACCTGYSVPWMYENASGAYELIVGSEMGTLFLYRDIDGNLQGSFTLVSDDFGGVKEGARLSLNGTDLDQDGKPDLAIGNLRGGLGLFHLRQDSSLTSMEPGLSSGSFSLKLYPNPADGQQSMLYLHFAERPRGLITAELMDIHGNILSAKKLSGLSENEQLQIPDIAPGMYLIRLTMADGKRLSKKWIRLP